MDYALTRPIPDIWTAARDMFTRLRRATHYKQWLYALEALVRKLVLLEALALAPPLPKPRPIQLPLYMQTKLPEPSRERSAQLGHAFRLRPRAKPHPARIRLLGKPQSRAELERDTLDQAQLERLKQARANRLPPVQRMLRRMNALSRVLEKPLPYAKRLARKLRRAPKKFLANIALKRQPRSPYIDPRVQRDAELHVWPATRAEYERRFPSAHTDTS
jgi:hypothetical protein